MSKPTEDQITINKLREIIKGKNDEVEEFQSIVKNERAKNQNMVNKITNIQSEMQPRIHRLEGLFMAKYTPNQIAFNCGSIKSELNRLFIRLGILIEDNR